MSLCEALGTAPKGTVQRLALVTMISAFRDRRPYHRRAASPREDLDPPSSSQVQS